MLNSFVHPSLLKLAGMRTRGRLSAMFASFRHPRKLFVSILGTVLAVVWLSNVIASILFREKYNPESLQLWMTLMLTIYAIWHFVRVSWQRPEAPIEWSESERNNLMTCPFSPNQLLQYRLVTVLGVTFVKAAIGTMLLLPDLPSPLVGFIALAGGLAFIELIRLIADVFAFGLGKRPYQLFRLSTVAVLSMAGLIFGMQAIRLTQSGDPDATIPIVFQFAQNFFTVIKSAIQTSIGEFISSPFALFVELMTTPTLGMQSVISAVVGLTFLAGLVAMLFHLHKWAEAADRLRQKSIGISQTDLAKPAIEAVSPSRIPRKMITLCGGAIVWRQLIGLSHYRSGAIIALIPPAILSAMPLFMQRLSDNLAILNFMGGLVFYSFLLLPSAMKFDFRRDYSRLLLLKMLPQPAWRIVVGQMLTPILITTLFQYLMLAFACVVRGIDLPILIAACLSFPAMNFAIYGWENLMFLIFPQKMKQEGIEVFLRTTVIFTAKGLTFAILFAILFLWAMVSTVIADLLGPYLSLLADHRIVFGFGVWLSVVAAALMMTYFASKQFANLEAYPESQAG